MPEFSASSAFDAMRSVAIGVLVVGAILLATYAVIVASSHTAPAYSMVRMLVGAFGAILTTTGLAGVIVITVAKAMRSRE